MFLYDREALLTPFFLLTHTTCWYSNRDPTRLEKIRSTSCFFAGCLWCETTVRMSIVFNHLCSGCCMWGIIFLFWPAVVTPWLWRYAADHKGAGSIPGHFSKANISVCWKFWGTLEIPMWSNQNPKPSNRARLIAYVASPRLTPQSINLPLINSNFSFT